MSLSKINLKSYIHNIPSDFDVSKNNTDCASANIEELPDINETINYSNIQQSLLSEIYGGNPHSQSDNAMTATAFYAQDINKFDYDKDEDEDEDDEDEYEEEDEQTVNKIDIARQVFQVLVNRPDSTRKGIIQHFVEQIGVTQSTAVSYYERLAKEAGLTNKGKDKEDLGQEVNMKGNSRSYNSNNQSKSQQLNNDDINLSNNEDTDDTEFDPERTGVLRTVDNAHLVYKRQDSDGRFEELWLYNIKATIGDELNIRRDILAGTDIPPKKTRSPDGTENYTLTTLGNAQYVHITGLPN